MTITEADGVQSESPRSITYTPAGVVDALRISLKSSGQVTKLEIIFNYTDSTTVITSLLIAILYISSYTKISHQS